MPGAAQAGQIARLPFDAVALDLQHGMIDHGDAVEMISAIVAAGKPAIVAHLVERSGPGRLRSRHGCIRRHCAHDQQPGRS